MIFYQLQKSLEVITAFIFLNLLWVIFCLPLVTIFPSTTAMFSVVREWKKSGVNFNVGRIFILEFKQNFKQSFILGIIWFIFGFILAIDFYYMINLSFFGKSVVLALLTFFAFIYLGMSIFILPIVVNFKLSIKEILKNAFLFSIGRLVTTISCLIIIASIVIIALLIPLIIWVIGSTIAFLVYTTISKLNKDLWTAANN
ncbi:hypothetical protein GCM10011351_13520 [Paraliobacillus quinghaiensis]|uniref:DUF624 domain-containing protein n=1 Tax=Paraliobacillus quinghaiensis TaxID=470815 RepID=A0A917TMC9_9BACI|nr:YesL family protein [Paraliobacillus quinghaiensis]GGM28813.1 hypothetical protein GCM10011351_13520 [Paraliobacillus quinghaiensis]